jgi:hypothetical protein
VALLALALAGYAALAADLVHGGLVSELDAHVTVRIAESMPAWAEWPARPFTWLGDMLGITTVVTLATIAVFATVLARTRGWMIAAVGAGLGLGVLIGVSRVVLNVHFVGDVLAGFCLGLSWLVACLLVVDNIRRRP